VASRTRSLTARALLLVNPASGRGRALALLRELRHTARAAGVPVAVTCDAADVTRRAREAAGRGLARVVVVGGDGTAHHAIRGLSGTECALGIVPAGNGNDLARALGLPRDPRAAFRVALDGPTRRIDLGLVGGVPFAGVASLGLDAEANRYANEAASWLGGPLVYAYAVLRTFVDFEPFGLGVSGDADRFEGRVMLAVVANSGWYGGGMHIAPAARLDDGRLDVVVVKEVARRVLAARLLDVFRGRHVLHPKVATFTTRAASITADRALDVFCDGEPVARAGAEPVRIEVAPRALWVASRG
jgi:diacylglycerol kinase (ATP)